MPLPVTRRRLLELLSLSGIAATTYSLNARANELLPSANSIKEHTDVNNLSFLAGGPQNSEIGQWAAQFSSAFATSLQCSAPLPLHYTTGYDGVTACNLFDTRTSPDGNTALITPGTAFISALAGDKRVHFDYERWIPVLTSLSPSVTIAHQPFHNSIPDMLKNRSMKVGIPTLISKDLPTLLAIELLQINAIPVQGLTDYPTALQAFRNREIDALQLNSTKALANLPSLLKEGFYVFFSLDGSTTYGPSFMDLYAKSRHYRASNALFEAWQAIALASRIDLSIVLPMLSPSSLVTKWRLAASKVIQDNSIIQLAKQYNMTLQSDPACIDILTRTCPSITATLALRRWLSVKASRWNTP